MNTFIFNVFVVIHIHHHQCYQSSINCTSLVAKVLLPCFSWMSIFWFLLWFAWKFTFYVCISRAWGNHPFLQNHVFSNYHSYLGIQFEIRISVFTFTSPVVCLLQSIRSVLTWLTKWFWTSMACYAVLRVQDGGIVVDVDCKLLCLSILPANSDCYLSSCALFKNASFLTSQQLCNDQYSLSVYLI